jgi:uncharacterized protein with NRDE domain
MCLVLFSWQPNAEYQLVVAANRDEFYNRPSDIARFWSDHPDILAGRDLQAGGTWLGITREGRFATVTNFRETPADPLPPRSRGDLTSNFLHSHDVTESYLKEIDQRAAEYRGFNLLLGQANSLHYYSNRQRQIQSLPPGCYGLSNQLLDCDWPKVIDGREQLASILKTSFTTEQLFQLLLDTGQPDEPWSAKFIQTLEYGTCAATVLIVKRNGDVLFEERVFDASNTILPATRYEFRLASSCP